MNKEKYVFSQLISFLNEDKFRRIVNKYHGNRYIKHFTCWNQLLALMFGQLSNRESLRDLIVALEAHHSKCYHLGMGKNVSKSSLARANQDRDYHIFEEYAYYLVSEARQKRVNHIFKLGGNVYAFDSTTIDLCLSVFWWAKFRKKKGDIKVHTLYDVETQIPAFFHITEASAHDSKAMIEIPYEPGSYYIFDRGYNSFKMLYKIHQMEAYFVMRAKKNLQYKLIQAKSIRNFCIKTFQRYDHELHEKVARQFMIIRSKYDFPFHAYAFNEIKNKEGGKNIHFKLSYPQRYLLSILEEMRLAGAPIRIILLKARQWGGPPSYSFISHGSNSCTKKDGIPLLSLKTVQLPER